ncbi:FAD-dependent monooxygenase [Microbacterium thalassium]|uniref:2-polyprenyl-6-methoxyphenol hydroxylase-like FAD-dependent oxidoreductase n=1 Tax=Microbacterium thalassium TaxID=362649 RepID=A0A7X0KTX9_9MICO|nr:FAD-dependent monooxygenase [Microbacterium thalassium]MBB6390528.1 2-polyprenyl-6-methoxyphenol hydroxylase-like FAD-dependent oxidoreductase [Microbacterium thalassium]GLK25639.1 FAD-dependent oxidoreductase [Microbacterium thalassium]
MTAVAKVVIAGGGITGLATAALLAEAGIQVDVLEAHRTSEPLGSGISLQGNALRMLDRVGVWDEVRAAASVFDGLVLRAPDAAGTEIFRVDTHRAGGADYPAAAGMYRPDLARILRDRADTVGAVVHDRQRVTAVTQHSAGVTVTTDAGLTIEADLLIGADGLHSSVRSLIGIDARPEMLDFGVWRAFVPLIPGVDCTELIYGGAAYYSGYSPTGPDTMYAYIVDDYVDRSHLSPEEMLEQMRGLAAQYHGPWDAIGEHLTDASLVNYSRMSFFTLPGDWHRGRVALIGDAAHSCPPTLAQGAAQGLEDAVVLAELLATRTALDSGLWADFYARRLPRAKAVVESSLQIAEWRRSPGNDRESAELMTEVSELLSQPL